MFKIIITGDVLKLIKDLYKCGNVRSCAYDFLEITELGLENVTEGAQEDWLLQEHHENYNENEVTNLQQQRSR